MNSKFSRNSGGHDPSAKQLPTRQYRRRLQQPNQLWKFALIVVLMLGICFRFANLDHKVYWFDEVATSIRIAGHTKSEVEQQFATAGTVNAEALLNYQTLQPETSFQQTLAALKKSPEQAPLYYVLARQWTQLFGSSILAIRSLSAFLSLIALPCIYWLALELFDEPRPGWIAVMLLSVSPFYVAYAQEARPYSLWATTILVSSVTYLRARRLNTTPSWLLYALSTVLGFYTSLLSLFVTVGHGLHLFLVERLTQRTYRYLGAITLAVIAFMPWLIVILSSLKSFQDNTVWMRAPMQFASRVAIWLAPILLTFGDLPFPMNATPVGIALALLLLMGLAFLIVRSRLKQAKQSGVLLLGGWVAIASVLCLGFGLFCGNTSIAVTLDPAAVGGILIAVLLFALVFNAIRSLRATVKQTIGLFILTLGITTPISLMVIDLIQMGQSSANPRYMFPVQMALQLSVAYLLAHKIDVSETVISRRRWTGILAFVLGVGLLSCTLNLEKSPIYQKSRNLHNLPIAEILNQAESPILIGEPYIALDLISLSHSLAPNIQISPYTGSLELFSSLCEEPSVYVFNPSPALQAQLQGETSLDATPVYQPKQLVPSQITLSLWSIQANTPCMAEGAASE